MDGTLLTKSALTAAIGEIKKSVFSKHLRRVECDKCETRDACVAYLCEDQREVVKDLSIDRSFAEVIRCKDCIYPESYLYVDGVPYTTKSVFYDVNSRTLKPRYAGKKGGVSLCPVCGRSFFKENNSQELCDLCALLDSEDEQELRRQRALYARYAGLLPIRKRLGGKDKRGVEDQSIIVIKVGNAYHVFDKIAGILSGDNGLTKKTVILDENSEV